MTREELEARYREIIQAQEKMRQAQEGLRVEAKEVHEQIEAAKRTVVPTPSWPPPPPDWQADQKRLQQEVNGLRKRVERLEKGRSGRKAIPMVAKGQRGVCALDPDCDSNQCPDATIYRYQQGCLGNACRSIQHEKYERRKQGTPALPKFPLAELEKKSTRALQALATESGLDPKGLNRRDLLAALADISGKNGES